MPDTMQKAANVLPLTQGIKLLKAASLGESVDRVLISIILMAVIAIFCTVTAFRFFKWE